jgi:sigma54-dependent transcription regulator
MYTNHRHYILLVFALLALIVTVLGYSFLKNAIVSEAVQSSKAIKAAALIDGQKQRAQDIASKYTRSADDRAKLNGYIVNEEEIVNLIEEIEKIGTDSNAPLQLSGVTTDTGVAVHGVTLNKLSAHIDVQGSWGNVRRALLLIENMPHAVAISNVHLETTGDVAKEKQWHLALDIKVLTVKQ